MDLTILLTVLTTVLTSGLVAGIVTFQLNATREDRLFKRQRLEELYEAYFDASQGLSAYWVPYFAVMSNSITDDQLLDPVKNRDLREPLPISRVQMLASLYHPGFLPFVDELLAIRDRASEIVQAHKKEYEQIGPHKSDALDEMHDLLSRLDEAEEGFTSALRGYRKGLMRRT